MAPVRSPKTSNRKKSKQGSKVKGWGSDTFRQRFGGSQQVSPYVDELARVLAKQIDEEIFNQKYAPIKDILILVGAGAFLAASIAVPNLPRALRPFVKEDEREAYKRFNVPYAKRALERLARQKLVEIGEEDGVQVVKITEAGRERILRLALDQLEIKKPKHWNGKWYLVSYDIPETLKTPRNLFVYYLRAWGFYPFHRSVYLHAYKEAIKAVEFLREYLRLGKYVQILEVNRIEKDHIFRKFFGV